MTAAAVLQAEELRWRASPPQRVLALVACFAVVSTALYLGSGMSLTWESTLAWTNIWAVGFGPVFAALLPWAMAQMNRRTRSGGTDWLATDPLIVRSARAALITVHLLVGNAIAFTVPALAGGLLGIEGPPPWADVAGLIVVCTCGQFLVAAFGLRVAEICSPTWALLLTVAFSLSWLLSGSSESSSWAWFPGNWVIRGALPLLGTHANGVLLDPASSLVGSSPWTAALLSIVVGVALISAPTWRASVPRRFAGLTGGLPRKHARSVAKAYPNTSKTAKSQTANGSHRARPAVAILSAIGPVRLLAPTVGLSFLTLLATRWRPGAEVEEILRLLLVPLAASIVPVALWATLEPSWRIIVATPARSARPMAVVALASWGAVVVGAATGLALLLGLGAISGPSVLVALLAAAACVAVVVPLVLWATTRLGPAGAVGIGVIGLIVGLLSGAGPLRDAIWAVAPWGWGALDALPRVVAALAAAVLIAPIVTFIASRAASIRAVAPEN